MIAAPEGTGRSKAIGSKMPSRVLRVAMITDRKKNPLSDWLTSRAAAAGITSRAPTGIAPITFTEATVTSVTSTTNR